MALDAIAGRWKTQITEDFANFLRILEVKEEIIHFLTHEEIIFIGEKTADNKLKFEGEGGKGGYEFELGQKFERNMFGIPVTSILKEKNGRLLKTVWLPNGKEVHAVFEVVGDKYVETYMYGEHHGDVVFEKLS